MSLRSDRIRFITSWGGIVNAKTYAIEMPSSAIKTSGKQSQLG